MRLKAGSLRRRHADLLDAVAVDVGDADGREVVPRARGRLDRLLRPDDVREDGRSQVGQVEPAEEPVPVGAVALGLVEMAGRLAPGVVLPRLFAVRGEHAAHLEHPLVHPVALLVLHEEVAPESAADEVRRLPETAVIVEDAPRLPLDFLRGKGERPFHHLAVGRGGQVDDPRRRLVVENRDPVARALAAQARDAGA